MPNELSADQREQLQRRLGLVGKLLTIEGVSKHDTRFDNEIALVADASALEAVVKMISSHMGDALKPDGADVPAALASDPMVSAMGGLRNNQTLYVNHLGDQLAVYVALWPWGGGKRNTIKIGVYGEH